MTEAMRFEERMRMEARTMAVSAYSDAATWIKRPTYIGKTAVLRAFDDADAVLLAVVRVRDYIELWETGQVVHDARLVAGVDRGALQAALLAIKDHRSGGQPLVLPPLTGIVFGSHTDDTRGEAA